MHIDTELRRLSNDEIDRHLKAISDAGYTLIPEFMSQSITEYFRERIEREFQALSERRYQNVSDNQARDQYVYNLQNRGVPYIRLAASKPIEAILIPFLNDKYYRPIPTDLPNYILAFYNARSSGPELPLHIDSYIPFPGKRTFSMQVAFILDDQSESNGCTVVVPRSHQIGEFSDRSFGDVVPIEARRGDVVVWDSRLWHGARANETETARWSLIATFRMWWLKQSMDIPRGLPEEIYAALSDEERSLLGYCSIPPTNEHQRISMKIGYEELKPRVSDYFV